MGNKYYNQEVFAKRLSQLMNDNNDTIYTLAEYLRLSPSGVSRYAAGKMAPKSLTIDAIAERYGVTPEWLMGAESVEKYPAKKERYSKIAILGIIAAGIPIAAQEDVLGYEYVLENEHVDFCLKVKGDSMVGARIFNGDIVFVRQQPEVENGEIAAVIIDGEEATLKRFYKVDNSVILRAENPNYKDMVFSKKDAKTIKVLGKAISFKSEVR